MFLRFLSILFTIAALTVSCTSPEQEVVAEKRYIEPFPGPKVKPSEAALRVCADPNNMPFSNSNGEGFENKIAELIASEMRVPVEYTWWAQRRGFFRNTLREARCDVVIGVPMGSERAETTRPYYRSSYVFISRADRQLDIRSFDDPRLRELKIGVPMIGDDGRNPPPVHALSNRGIINNIKGYTVYGDYKEESPPAKIVNAVARGEVDIAIVWGPLAGYFADRQPVPLSILPAIPDADPYLPFAYDIGIGVRHGEEEFRAKLDDILERCRADIEKILAQYHVPTVAPSNNTIAEDDE